METDYRVFLENELKTRRELNPSYSLRAFARDLGLSAPRLSQVMSRKQGLSYESAKKVSKRLPLSEKEREIFCHSAGLLHSRNNQDRNLHQERMDQIRNETNKFLDLEYFKVISDWYHFAILELTYTEDFQSRPSWISRKLGVP